MATKYLQLRIHELQCIKRTQNRQNFMGIPLETDPDAIDLAAIVADAVQGVVAQAPTLYLGNRYNDGRKETWSPPKIAAEIPISDTDAFPRRVQVTINMAEKDDGAGFDELMGRVAEELAHTLEEEVGRELDDSTLEREFTEQVGVVVGDVIKMIFTEIGKALGLGDDPFRPVLVSHQLASFTAAPNGTQTIDIFEPNPEHKGRFKLTYSWHLSDRSAMSGAVAGESPADMGRATGALSRPAAAVPYPRPFRTFRFARPLTKQAKPVTIQRPATKSTAAKPPKQAWFYPMSVRALGGDKPPK